MRVDFAALPLDVRRRAARAVAALVEDGLSPNRRHSGRPSFGQATAVYRPDLHDIAYWEIELVGLRTVMPAVKPDGDVSGAEQGFVLVATGAHDVPVPHFSLDLAPPSRQLERLGDVDRVYKLDALCYAGLDAAGTFVGHLGTMPPKLVGVPDRVPTRLPGGFATAVAPTGASGARRLRDGDVTEPAKVRRSRESRPIQLEAWQSWDELTQGYADSYRLHLAALAERAARRWEIEKLTEEFGEGIHSGQTHTVWLLEDGAVEVTGPGADHVVVELNPQPLPPLCLLSPRADASVEDTSFDLHVSYRSGAEETLRFFIVPDDAPSSVGRRIGPLGEER